MQSIAHEKGGDDDENALFNEHEIDEEVEKVLETDLLESMVAKLARITSLVLPGNEQNFVNETNMDQNTKDWIHREYLNEEGKGHGRGSMIHKSPGGKGGGGTSTKTLAGGSRTGYGSNHSPGDTTRATVFRKSMQPPDNPQALGSPAMPKDAKQIHREKMERAINTWTYDIEALSKIDMKFSTAYIFNTFDILDEFGINPKVMDSFLGELENRYINSNPYHNWKHAVDVCHTVFR